MYSWLSCDSCVGNIDVDEHSKSSALKGLVEWNNSPKRSSVPFCLGVLVCEGGSEGVLDNMGVTGCGA